MYFAVFSNYDVSKKKKQNKQLVDDEDDDEQLEFVKRDYAKSVGGPIFYIWILHQFIYYTNTNTSMNYCTSFSIDQIYSI